MAKKKQLIIPIFIPHQGCSHQCIFCNQLNVTGEKGLPDTANVENTIKSFLKTWNRSGRKEVAFYGGSFTGLAIDDQKNFLETAYQFIDAGLIDSIRISTRPDYINLEVIDLLKKYKVETVELGVQSMVDEVLKLSGRGHTADDTIRAVALMKKFGFKIGLQIMPGLPGDNRESVLNTADMVAQLSPDFVRIYPLVVIRDTPLERLYRSGKYRPWTLSDMVDICREIVSLFTIRSIPVIKLGLQHTDMLKKSVVAGPYHPAFRDLVEGRQQKVVIGQP